MKLYLKILSLLLLLFMPISILNLTTGFAITSVNEEKKDDNEAEKTIFAIVGAITGILALSWNIFNFYNSKKGFMKLKMECKQCCNDSTKYLITNTSIENTSSRFIYIGFACVVIFEKAKIEKIDGIIEELKLNVPELNFHDDNNFYPNTLVRKNVITDNTRLWSYIKLNHKIKCDNRQYKTMELYKTQS
jgi:hypothetical protein